MGAAGRSLAYNALVQECYSPAARCADSRQSIMQYDSSAGYPYSAANGNFGPRLLAGFGAQMLGAGIPYYAAGQPYSRYGDGSGAYTGGCNGGYSVGYAGGFGGGLGSGFGGGLGSGFTRALGLGALMGFRGHGGGGLLGGLLGGVLLGGLMRRFMPRMNMLRRGGGGCRPVQYPDNGGAGIEPTDNLDFYHNDPLADNRRDDRQERVVDSVAGVSEKDKERAKEQNAFDAKTLALINKYRKQNNLGPVSFDPRLQLIALEHSKWQDANGLGHQENRPGWETVQRRMSKVGLSGWAENAGYGAIASPEQLVNMWIQSAPHRRALLDPNVRIAGVSKFGKGATLDMV